MFHSQNGLYFERLKDGSVRIIKRKDAMQDAEIIADETLDANCWASIIATMSYYGEEDYGFYRATLFHQNEPIPDTVTIIDK